MAVGRRAGAPDTRGEIVAAARAEFAAKGFDGTSLRGVARRAGVDPALVHHYFDGKQDLFLAGLELPFSPRERLVKALDTPRDNLGRALVTFALEMWDDPQNQPALLAVMRSVATAETDTSLVRRGFVEGIVLEGLSKVPDPPSRHGAALAVSHVVGLLFTRYLLRLDAVVEMSAEEIIDEVGPTVQRYLDL